MSPDSCRHQVNTPDFQRVCPRTYVFLQHRMRWTRLRSACWCMLIYSVTKKPSPPEGIEFLRWYPPSWGGTGHSHWLHYSVHHPKLTSIEAWPGPNEVALGPSSASYQEVLSVFTWLWKQRAPLFSLHCEKEYVWGESSHGLVCAVWQKLAFIFKPNDFCSCLFTGGGKTNKASHECFDQFVTMGMALSCEGTTVAINWRPHQMVMVKGCNFAPKKGKGHFCASFEGVGRCISATWRLVVTGTKMNTNNAWKPEPLLTRSL